MRRIYLVDQRRPAIMTSPHIHPLLLYKTPNPTTNRHGKLGCTTLGCPKLGCPSLGCLKLGCPSLGRLKLGCPSLECPSLGRLKLGCPSLGCPSLGCPSLGCPSLGCPSLGCPSLGCPSLGRPSLGCRYPNLNFNEKIVKKMFQINLNFCGKFKHKPLAVVIDRSQSLGKLLFPHYSHLFRIHTQNLATNSNRLPKSQVRYNRG